MYLYNSHWLCLLKSCAGVCECLNKSSSDAKMYLAFSVVNIKI